ncbi:YkyB family protein [Salibacterium qingdaonense]|uniref:YkyB-like protein n=1 Tax=Salibacterium qingdaonense TaxID=266892 RepID=A0A1I4QN17_9BACI|nr:YkyB family protein [Salibacterium qingdaonense]SFM41105.1 YkyB-like protein [Salibacterium qingdaonense]
MHNEFVTYKGWNDIPEGYYTKTTLKRDYRLKPIDEGQPESNIHVQTRQGWKYFNLYHIDNCKEIKQRKLNIRNFESTDSNIAKALYVINKSAKISRDTKSDNYSRGNHGVVSRSKSRQYYLYDLKDEVIKKLKSDNRIEIVGYHTQQDENHLLMYKLSNFTFHVPCDEDKAKKYPELGNIAKISAESKKVDMKYNEAIKLLEEYSGYGSNEEQLA